MFPIFFGGALCTHFWGLLASQLTLVVENLFIITEDIREMGLFLGWEDPLEKVMATHCSFLAWRIPWTEEPGGLQSVGSQRVGHD